MNTSTFAAEAGAEEKNPENTDVEPSPVADTLEMTGASPVVANSMNVEPS
jgi:hypothetical protein